MVARHERPQFAVQHPGERLRETLRTENRELNNPRLKARGFDHPP